MKIEYEVNDLLEFKDSWFPAKRGDKGKILEKEILPKGSAILVVSLVGTFSIMKIHEKELIKITRPI